MKQRVAKKILKNRGNLDYTPDQLKRAEQRMNVPAAKSVEETRQAESQTEENPA